MKDSDTDARRTAILSAARQVFAQYGFRKTSMDDIAKGVGMSRPALYLHYKNKEDILRSLVADYYEATSRDIDAALRQGGPKSACLQRAFNAQVGGLAELIISTPHGHELLEQGASVALDLVLDGEKQLQQIYADWLSEEADEGRVQLPKSANLIAETINAALKGVKKPGVTIPVFRARMQTLAILIGNGLEAGPD